jgi:Ca2+-binding EF-hand superfamily protein
MNSQLLDPKETGFLSLENLQDIVSGSGEQMSDEEVRLMFEDADTDGDGKVGQTSLRITYFAQCL